MFFFFGTNHLKFSLKPRSKPILRAILLYSEQQFWSLEILNIIESGNKSFKSEKVQITAIIPTL